MSELGRRLVTAESVRAVALAAVFALMVGTFLSYRLRLPPTASVDGIYVGKCGSLSIYKGEASFAGDTARFKLIFDKFGLAGELDRPLGPFFVQTVDGKREPDWLSFDKNSVSAMKYGQQECVFRRTR